MRKPLEGVWNIIRFNWHFYVLSAGFLLIVFLSRNINSQFKLFAELICITVSVITIISLLVSYYIYDFSGIYNFKWLEKVIDNKDNSIINIHAGFDETSALLKSKFKHADFRVLDFYDPLKHTEISIKRARKAYPSFPGTKQVHTTNLPLENNVADYVFLIFAAHEIRNDLERVSFFKEIHRITKPHGQVIIIEHLRNIPNFIAYNIGFFHFYPRWVWKNTFKSVKLDFTEEIRYTPFVSTFILTKNGNSF